jgi:hypothetical protein
MKRALLALLMAPMVAQAQFHSGNDLLEMMRSESVGKQMQGLGYIQGVTDALTNTVTCPPRVSGGQVMDLIKNYLEANPAMRHFTAWSITSYVLKATWPCKSI